MVAGSCIRCDPGYYRLGTLAHIAGRRVGRRLLCYRCDFCGMEIMDIAQMSELLRWYRAEADEDWRAAIRALPDD